MDIILWRHAEAEEGVIDDKRALTSKGHKQAKRMAKWLRERFPKEVSILVSPAKRAQQTAEALTDDFTTVAAIGTSASARDVLNAAGWPKGDATVLVVGHQPTLGETAALIMTGHEAPWPMKKGAIYWIAYGDSQLNLRAVISPDLL